MTKHIHSSANSLLCPTCRTEFIPIRLIRLQFPVIKPVPVANMTIQQIQLKALFLESARIFRLDLSNITKMLHFINVWVYSFIAIKKIIKFNSYERVVQRISSKSLRNYWLEPSLPWVEICFSLLLFILNIYIFSLFCIELGIFVPGFALCTMICCGMRWKFRRIKKE